MTAVPLQRDGSCPRTARPVGLGFATGQCDLADSGAAGVAYFAGTRQVGHDWSELGVGFWSDLL